MSNSLPLLHSPLHLILRTPITPRTFHATPDSAARHVADKARRQRFQCLSLREPIGRPIGFRSIAQGARPLRLGKTVKEVSAYGAFCFFMSPHIAAFVASPPATYGG